MNKSKRRRTLKGIDTSKVTWPKTPTRRREMRAKIVEFSEKGYKVFETQTLPCLNVVESPSPDQGLGNGWTYVGFFHDCRKRDQEKGEYNDIRLFCM